MVLQTQDDMGVTYVIGAVEPPAGFDGDVHAALETLWNEWWESFDTDSSGNLPDSDSEFISYLVEKGWKEMDSPEVHTFE
jgi:hypothetical protein